MVEVYSKKEILSNFCSKWKFLHKEVYNLYGIWAKFDTINREPVISKQLDKNWRMLLQLNLKETSFGEIWNNENIPSLV